MTASTTNTSTAPGRLGAAAQPTVPQRVPRGPRRSIGQLTLAVLLIVGCAALGGVLWATGSARTPVLVAARNIPVGTLLTEQDLTAAEISGTGVAAIGSDDAGRLLGQTATTTIPAGILLNADMVAPSPPPGPGKVAVGLALSAGRLPAELAAGRQVQVVLVPAGQEVQTDPEGRVLVEAAEVLSVAADPSGAWLVSVAVDQAAAPAVTSTAAVDRVALVMLPIQQKQQQDQEQDKGRDR